MKDILARTMLYSKLSDRSSFDEFGLRIQQSILVNDSEFFLSTLRWSNSDDVPFVVVGTY